MMSLFPFWTRTLYRTYIFNGGTESSQTKSKISCVLQMNGGFRCLGRHEGESLMT